jgi:hypothetical protein
MMRPVDPLAVLDQRRRQLTRIERLAFQHRYDLTPVAITLLEHAMRSFSDDVQALARAVREAK